MAARYPTRRSPDAGAAGFHGRERRPEPRSFDPAGRKGTPRIRATRRDLLLYGEEEVDLRAVEQLFDESQTRATGYAMAAAARDFEGLPVRDLLDSLEARLDEAGLESLTSEGRSGAHPGRLARPRRYEIAAAMNRLRRGRFRKPVLKNLKPVRREALTCRRTRSALPSSGRSWQRASPAPRRIHSGEKRRSRTTCPT